MSILRRDTYASSDTPLWTPNQCIANAMAGFGNVISLPDIPDGTRAKMFTVNKAYYTSEVGATYDMCISLDLQSVTGTITVAIGYYNTSQDDYTVVSANTLSSVQGAQTTLSMGFTWLGGMDDAVDVLLTNNTGEYISGCDAIVRSFFIRKMAVAGVVRNVISVVE